MPRIRETLQDLQRSGLLESAERAFARVRVCATLGEAVDGAAYIQESVAETLPVKRAAFEAIAEVAPGEAIVASSTSALPGSRFMCGLTNSARCLVAHPTNPPYLTPLTELCPTAETLPATLERARAILEGVGQSVIDVRREVTGYVLNRLQGALLAEALHLVAAGVVSARDIDLTLTKGLGLRWCFMGPFLTGHLNANGGYRDYMRLYGETFRSIAQDLHVKEPWPASAIDAVHADLIAQPPVRDVRAGQAWRDRRLMQLANHLAQCARDETTPGAGE
jgi:3-hydroxyacyl-CoA dehydrogenase